jgi:hypothetical protein
LGATNGLFVCDHQPITCSRLSHPAMDNRNQKRRSARPTVPALGPWQRLPEGQGYRLQAAQLAEDRTSCGVGVSRPRPHRPDELHRLSWFCLTVAELGFVQWGRPHTLRDNFEPAKPANDATDRAEWGRLCTIVAVPHKSPIFEFILSDFLVHVARRHLVPYNPPCHSRHSRLTETTQSQGLSFIGR